MVLKTFGWTFALSFDGKVLKREILASSMSACVISPRSSSDFLFVTAGPDIELSESRMTPQPDVLSLMSWRRHRVLLHEPS